MSLRPDAMLRVAPALRVQCKSGTEFTLELGPMTVAGGPHTLSILNAFRTPSKLSDVLAQLQSQLTGVHDWIELTSQVAKLRRAGMLLDEEAWRESRTLAGNGSNFGGAPVHITMLNDRERTSRYLAAVLETVHPGDVVVDLGTGSGVMAVAAAQAGAARVFAIEASGIAKAARRVFLANGVADRISLIEGYSTQVELPERADVLIAEIIGDEPLAERILECTADAVRRFLKPNARIIPLRLRVMAAPVEVPTEVRDQLMISPTMLADWQRDYGIDFSPLAALAKESLPTLSKRQLSVAHWKMLADPQPVTDFDLSQRTHAKPQISADFQVSRKGRIDAFLLWFEASLTLENVLTTDPRAPRPDNHWRHPVHLLAESLAVRRGDAIRMSLDHSDRSRVLVNHPCRLG